MDSLTADDHIEIALAELQYMSADALFGAEDRSPDEEGGRVASFYQSACRALDLSLEVIKKAKTMESKCLVA